MQPELRAPQPHSLDMALRVATVTWNQRYWDTVGALWGPLRKRQAGGPPGLSLRKLDILDWPCWEVPLWQGTLSMLQALSHPQPEQSGRSLWPLGKHTPWVFQPLDRGQRWPGISSDSWQEPSVHIFPNSMFHGVTLVAWNRSQWEYLYHRNWQTMKIRTFFPWREGWLFNICC